MAGVLAAVAAVFAPRAVSAADDDLPQAQRLLLRGNYAEAAELFAPLIEKHPAAAVGLARSWEARGRSDRAVAVLATRAGGNADMQAELARLAFKRGDYSVAERRVDAAIAADPDQLLARWIRAELARVNGDLDEAQQGYRWLVGYHNNHRVADAESARWIALAATRYARWNRLPDQLRFLVNDLYPAALKQNADYWPAWYDAGRIFLRAYNRSEATRHFDAALAVNPNAAEIHAAIAEAALESRQFERAEASVRRALQLNPECLEAWLLKAELAWANFRPEQAETLLADKALPLNPASLQTLGRLAACRVLAETSAGERGGDASKRIIEQVEARNLHAGEFYLAAGRWLMARHKARQAERFFTEARQRMPQLVGPRSELGLLLMRTGEEARARDVLDEAFDVDPFNVRVNNMLGLFEVLDAMETRRTEHVRLVLDPQRDALLGRYAAEYLDRVYPTLCEQFGYTPPEEPLIEIFNEHRQVSGRVWFATRMSGLPYVGPLAASTGYMVAMTSPDEPSLSRTFNWAVVLRHELVHVVTLQQTNFNIPHWFTEALAVRAEGYPRPQAWNELLRRRVPREDVFDLQTINFGFSRPRSSDDWHLAYCQAELYLECLLEHGGDDVVGRMLEAYARGMTTEEAIDDVLGMPLEQFERLYDEYLDQVVAELSGLRVDEELPFVELLRAQRAKPDDPDLAAQLAYNYLRRRVDDDARRLARRAVNSQAGHPLGSYVLARLYASAGQTAKAIELLDRALDAERPHEKVLQLLALLYVKSKQYGDAAELYRMAARLDRHNPRWLRSLARVYLLQEDDANLADVLSQLAARDADDLAVRKKLADLGLAARDYEEAERWARESLYIDVTDAAVHLVLARALVGLDRADDAIQEFRVAVELAPEEPRQRFALADACLQAGRTEEARQALRALLEVAPEYPGAAQLLENLE
jgi:tetratricopeptide (TPR) repeat protein